MQLQVRSVLTGGAVRLTGLPCVPRRDAMTLINRGRPLLESSGSFVKGTRQRDRRPVVPRAIMDDTSDTQDLEEMCDTDLGFCELWENEMVAFWRSWNDMAETERHKVRGVATPTRHMVLSIGI